MVIIWKSDPLTTPSGWSLSCTRRAKGKPLRPRLSVYFDIFIRPLYILGIWIMDGYDICISINEHDINIYIPSGNLT